MDALNAMVRRLEKRNGPDLFCGNQIVMGPRHDETVVECDKLPHRGITTHEGDGPFPGLRVSWEGGGWCAGDSLPHRNLRVYDADTGEEVPYGRNGGTGSGDSRRNARR
jgi:hypothetical protein